MDRAKVHSEIVYELGHLSDAELDLLLYLLRVGSPSTLEALGAWPSGEPVSVSVETEAGNPPGIVVLTYEGGKKHELAALVLSTWRAVARASGKPMATPGKLTPELRPQRPPQAARNAAQRQEEPHPPGWCRLCHRTDCRH